MAKEINLNSIAWCDVIFDGRNKEYGAYQMRLSSSKRHLLALACTTLFVGIIICTPSFIEAVAPKAEVAPMTEKYTVTDLTLPPKAETVKPVTPPPPPVQATQQYVAPKIVVDNLVTKANEMKRIDEILNNHLAVGETNTEGSTRKTDPISNTQTLPPLPTLPPEEKPVIWTGGSIPEYPGGESELTKFLNNNIIYPSIAIENGIQGRVVLKFLVGKDGWVSDIQVIESVDPSCDKEAVRVVKKMPRWIPGRQNGKPAPVYYRLPVLFKLQ